MARYQLRVRLREPRHGKGKGGRRRKRGPGKPKPVYDEMGVVQCGSNDMHVRCARESDNRSMMNRIN